MYMYVTKFKPTAELYIDAIIILSLQLYIHGVTRYMRAGGYGKRFDPNENIFLFSRLIDLDTKP